MLYDAIDSVLLAVTDLDSACRPYERLGLRLSGSVHGRRSLNIGEATNLFAVHLLADTGLDQPLAIPLRAAQTTGRGLFAIMLAVADLDTALSRLAAQGVEASCKSTVEPFDAMAWLPLHDLAGTDLALVQHGGSSETRHAAVKEADVLGHSFPLKRLDHLASVTHDLDAKTRFWTDVLGVPLAGEVRTPTLLIRQFKIGDAILELLGPAVADSPIYQRVPGLISMASWEVEELMGVVRQARAAGFAVSDPTAGPLPGTRIATIQGTELVGLNMQLLQYV